MGSTVVSTREFSSLYNSPLRTSVRNSICGNNSISEAETSGSNRYSTCIMPYLFHRVHKNYNTCVYYALRSIVCSQKR